MKNKYYDETACYPTFPKRTCPDCDEDFGFPQKRCICRNPLMICIPPGEHIHIQCPVHGDVKIYGPRRTWMRNESPRITQPKHYKPQWVDYLGWVDYQAQQETFKLHGWSWS